MSRRRVLLVDDRAAVRQTVKDILDGYDCDFIEADDGAAALALIKAAPFDVIFLDLKLPDIPGTEVLRRARELREPLGRVIVLTGFLDPGAREETERLGAFRHLTKAPISLAQVREAFTAALGDGVPPPEPTSAPARLALAPEKIRVPSGRTPPARVARNDPRPRILVLDDDPRWLESIRLVFGGDFAVTTTPDPDDACRKAKRTRFNLVILDMNLGGITGLDVFAKMVQTTVNLKAIILTGDPVDLDVVVGAGRLGARTFFLKSQLGALPVRVREILNEPVLPPSVFLSYDRRDRRAVKRLYDRLVERGVRPWMDTKHLLPGDEWDPRTGEHIRKSDHFIFCHSHHSHDKEGPLRKELAIALDHKQELLEDRHFLLVARLDRTEVLGTLRKYTYADLFQRGGFERLMEAIAADATARS